MDHNQKAKRNMFSKIMLFFTNNATIWAAFTRLVTEITTFVGLVGQIDTEATKQALTITGAATDKENFRIAMAKIVVKYARKARVWAHDTNNATLEALFNVQKDDLLKDAETHAIELATNIATALNDNIAALAAYNILPANVTAINLAITNFSGATGTTGDAQALTKVGTDALPGLFEKADTSLDIIYDLIISEYSDSNPDEVLQFKNDHHIDNIAVNHSGVRVHITDALTGNDLAGAKLSILGTGKTTVADLHGIAEIIKVKPSEYNILVSIPGYPAKAQLIRIKSGKITELDMSLTAGSGGGGGTPPAPVTIEGNLANLVATNINTDNLSPLFTMILLAATGSIMRFYLSDTPGALYNGSQPFIDVLPGQSTSKTIEQLQTLLGANAINKYLNVQNIGATIGHYSVTFS